ncbi:ABC transporter substrate-binding protein (plasmid) [Deinococcus sp. KNUC1210]|uniref:ABC transporter substrate-binding protein n=1 Tax=Deinococcus sp. KNUC1210 TaxID=2917691 RepID=UPI001EEFE21E|nr:ABC transporter substrate-binding protein [Deinococcus sp. KNUC1210]ULH17057.1 ABC transporter substrate-binding protein [Deinococcus sp. KNUC1210]
MKKSLITLLTLGFAVTASSAFAAGKNVTVAYSSDFHTLDPAIGDDTQNWPVEHALFVTLLTYKTGTALSPWAATDMGKTSADGKTYTFTIRKGITFADGEPTDAAAFKYALERVVNPKSKSPQSGKAGWFGNLVGADAYVDGKAKDISGIKLLDPYTIQFQLKKPDRTFLNYLATPFASAVARKAAEKWGSDYSHHVVGNGPFTLKSWTPGQEMVLARNPNYFDKANAATINEVHILLNLNEQVALLRAQRGDVDVLGNGVPSAQFVSISQNPRYKTYLHSAVQIGTDYLYMNTRKAPFDNKLVREAVSHAIDKKRILQLMNGRGKIANQILPEGLAGHDDSVADVSYDPAKAKALMAQAGLSGGVSTTLYTLNDEAFTKIAQAVQGQLAVIGIKADIKALPQAEYINTISTPGATAIGLSGWFQAYPDASDFLPILFKSSAYVQGGWNLSGYSNKQVDAMLDQAQGVPLKASVTIYQKAQKQILSEYPWVPLFYPVQYDFVNPRISGFDHHPVWGFIYQNWKTQ